jgi:DNA polymerase III epsilon subunit-like protein
MTNQQLHRQHHRIIKLVYAYALLLFLIITEDIRRQSPSKVLKEREQRRERRDRTGEEEHPTVRYCG